MTNNTYLRRYRNTTYPEPYEILDLTSNSIQLKTTDSVNSRNATPFSSYGYMTTMRTVNQYIYISNFINTKSTIYNLTIIILQLYNHNNKINS